MGSQTVKSDRQEYHLRALIERMQRQGMSEQEITKAVTEARAEQVEN